MKWSKSSWKDHLWEKKILNNIAYLQKAVLSVKTEIQGMNGVANVSDAGTLSLSEQQNRMSGICQSKTVESFYVDLASLSCQKHPRFINHEYVPLD